MGGEKRDGRKEDGSSPYGPLGKVLADRPYNGKDYFCVLRTSFTCAWHQVEINLLIEIIASLLITDLRDSLSFVSSFSPPRSLTKVALY